MSRGEEVRPSGFIPVSPGDIEPSAQFVHREGQERLKQDSQVGCYLQGDVHYRLNAVRVGFDHLPRLSISQVLVAQTCQVHGFGQCLPEAEGLEVALHVLTACHDRTDGLTVVISHLTRCRHFTFVIVIGEHQGSVDEVTENSHQLVVVSSLKLLPGEVVILCLRGAGTECVAQRVLLAGEINEIFMKPDGPVA